MKITTIALTALLILTACNSTKHAPKDYVSAYDFTSARLVDLPWEMGAAMVGSSSTFDYNDYVKEHHPDWNYVQFQLGRNLFDDLSRIPEDSTNHVYTVDDPASIIPEYDSVDDSCCLADGQLMHELECIDGVVKTSSNSWFVLSVEVQEYRDYNKDGYMDVIVFRQLPGSAAPRETLVLSRRKPEGQFYVVEHLNGAARFGSSGTHSWQKNPDGTTASQMNVFVTSNMTISGLAQEYGVSEEIIREANGLGKDDEVQPDTCVVIPDQE